MARTAKCWSSSNAMTWFLAKFFQIASFPTKRGGSLTTSQVNSVGTWKLFEEKTLRFAQHRWKSEISLGVKPRLDLRWRSLAPQVSSEAISEASKQTGESRARSTRSDAAVNVAPKLGVLFEMRGGDELCTLQWYTRLPLLVNHENPTQPPCATSLTIGCFPRYQCSHRQLYALAGTGAFFVARWHAVFFHSAVALLRNSWLEGACWACWAWDSL